MDSEPFPTDGSTHTLPFRLIKAEPIQRHGLESRRLTGS